MLSYKHAFHAGNHADVIKHLCLVGVLEHFKLKAKPFCLFDTHSGAGHYEIANDEVQKNKEFTSGIAYLESYSAQSSIVQQYLECLNQYRQQGLIPGSPAIALHSLRAEDSLIAMELHPSEATKLKSNLRHTHASVHARDGFEGLIAMAPPRQKRGLVLIDPPYEQISEYSAVVTCVEKVIAKWQNACFVIWYPLLGSRAGKKSGKSESMLLELKKVSANPLLNMHFKISDPLVNEGMYGSGVVIVNPPWQLDETLRLALTELSNVLQVNESLIDWIE